MEPDSQRSSGNCQFRVHRCSAYYAGGWKSRFVPLFSGGATAVWNSQTNGNPGAFAYFQGDGNLVVYRSDWLPLWHSQTSGNPNSTLVLSYDGNLSIFNTQSGRVWSTNTSKTPTSTLPGGRAPFNLRFANDRFHYWRSIETDPGQKAEWIWRFAGPGGEIVYEPTDLSFGEASPTSSSVDVTWEVTNNVQVPGAAAEVICAVTGTVAGRCQSFTLKINEATVGQLSSHMRNNLVCHEIAHTLGFNDGGSTGSSCLTSGNNSRLGWWERDEINWVY